MLRFLLVSFFMLATQFVNAQGEANIWYFGRNAGVDFNSGVPVGLTNGALNTGEGCASISDRNGNLIFYTDGIFVYNRNHQQMPNGFGLQGNPSSAQSAIIVPRPGSNTRFYIFTVAAEGLPPGFRYSEVDITLNNGLGDVIAANKNTLLFTPSTEKVTAVKHANGLYVWVIGHGLNTNRYYAYLVDCNGVNAPVTSDVGQVEGWPGWGCLTASPDGTRLATAMRAQGFEVLDFNPVTGVVSNPILLSNPGGAYGVSFSPDNNLVYGLSIENGNMYQWNLQAGTPANIIASIVNLGLGPGTGVNYRGGAMQIGPDGRIYIPHFNQPFLASINNPNVVGLGCNVQFNSVDLLGRNAVLGLPPFIMSYFDTVATVSFSGTCVGGATNFIISGNTTFLDSVRWFFDDPSTGIQNTSTLLSPTHTFSASGIFNVQLIRYIDCIADTTIQPIEILPPPVGNQNVSICPNATFTLPSGSVVSAEGVYNDTISDANGCDSVVVTNISHYPVDTTLLSITICEGQSHTAGGQAQTASGIYVDVLQNQYGCDSTVVTNLTVTPRVYFNNNIEICEGESYVLPGGNSVNSAGIYNDTLIASSTCDSIVITNLLVTPRVFFNNDVAICPDENYVLPSGNSVNTAGTYYDTLIAASTCDSVVITFLSILPVNDTTITISICDGESYFAGGQLQTTTGTYIDTILNQFGCDSVVRTNLTVNPVSYSEAFDTICNYESYTLPSGNVVNTNGIYVDTLVNAFSCDSIITTHLNVIVPDSSFRSITVCYGDSFFVVNSFQTVSGIYTEVYPSATRCDSFSITNLTVLNPISFERDVYVCYEKTFFVGGDEQSNPGVYYDTLFSALGCDSLIITNLITSYDDSCGCEKYFIPNAFSPNGDGENDFFEFYGGCFKDFYFSIHNRWGEKVFETENPRDKWDGYFNGKPQSLGVYVYYLRGTTFNNVQHKKKGSITLIR